ncbi:uncharacterized protein LOC119685284 [Teleopsis dalmanni]|uniref:uncharacterized protein LOC119685284 n=1 Tax=Teleopsis dalmanni TaxID=139649 RepID=UPI0018CE6029|nr:uncharacterized protein LOC119685284 [Teleopsis dalmanni]
MSEQIRVDVATPECHHFRGVFGLFPWNWGRPCRYCRRHPQQQVIVVAAPNRPCAAPNTAYAAPPMQSTPADTYRPPPPGYDAAVNQYSRN